MIRKEDYREMEIKVGNDWIKADVMKVTVDGHAIYVSGSKDDSGDYYMGTGAMAMECREIKRTKTVVKSALAIIQNLIDDGYECSNEGNWIHAGSKLNFYARMFTSCGQEPDIFEDYEPEWLEEVSLDESSSEVDEQGWLFN